LSFLDLASQNLLSPMVLFFGLGLCAALARSDLSIPESVAKFLALYLMMSIGFKGGVAVATSGLDGRLASAMLAGIVLSALIPLIGYALLRATSRLPVADAAAVAAHYGSISIVTFVAGTQIVGSLGLSYEGYLVAVAAVMETPAIITALLLVNRARRGAGLNRAEQQGEGFGALLREIGLNASVVMLVGAFVIGWITGERGMKAVDPLVTGLFFGLICFFLLDMGLVAGRGLREGLRQLGLPAILFGLYMPLISAFLAAGTCPVLGLSRGGSALLITLSASASYIAVPAAMRLALPEARPSIYLTLSLGVTFPFNLTLGIPLYVWLAGLVAR
jgi:hypothetical protein